jgi:hypothetical protein
MKRKPIYYWDGKPGTAPGCAPDEYLVWDCDNNKSLPGWYVGGPSDPLGPFDTEMKARQVK